MPLRQRQEIQKMLRGLIFAARDDSSGADPLVCARPPGRAAEVFLTGGRSRPGGRLQTRASAPPNLRFGGVFAFLLWFAAATAQAAVWPPQLGSDQLKSENAVQITANRPLWEEFGLTSATAADYGAFQATAYRFKDPTGAFAAEQWLRATNPAAILAGNYILACTGKCPATKVFEDAGLPHRMHAEAPLLWAYLPSSGLVPGSARYALGPVGLKQFAPRIPTTAAAFQYGTEVATAKYRTAAGEEQLVLFSFPLPQMARPQVGEMEKLNGAVVRRSGSLVALILNPPDPAAAQSLLSQINYRAQVSWDEQPAAKVTAQGVAQMVLTILKLAGMLILFCAMAGLGYAGLRLARKRLGHENANEAMIVLHLVDR